VETFSQTEPFEGVGVNDALNTTAFGLSTGKAAPIDQATAFWAAAVDLLMADQENGRTSSSSSSPDLAELAAVHLCGEV